MVHKVQKEFLNMLEPEDRKIIQEEERKEQERQKQIDKIMEIGLNEEKKREVKEIVESVHRKLINTIYKKYGLWLAVHTMVELFTFYGAANILHVSAGYLYRILKSDQQPSQKIIFRVMRGLEKWINADESK